MSRREHPVLRRVVRKVVIFAFRLAFRPQVRYVDDTARAEAFREPCIVACNHVRGWDAAAVIAALRDDDMLVLMAKDTIERSRILQFLLPVLPVIQIDRWHASLSWLRDSRKAIKEGRTILIHPEGKCAKGGPMDVYHPGFAMLAEAAGCRVTPVYLNGAYHVFFGRRFRMMVGRPVSLAELGEGRDAAALALRERTIGLERLLSGEVKEGESA